MCMVKTFVACEVLQGSDTNESVFFLKGVPTCRNQTSFNVMTAQVLPVAMVTVALTRLLIGYIAQ